jgi:hypothetical protein
MSSTLGRPLRALVSSTAAFRPVVAHARCSSPERHLVRPHTGLDVSLQRRAYAKLPSSSAGPAISLPPPPTSSPTLDPDHSQQPAVQGSTPPPLAADESKATLGQLRDSALPTSTSSHPPPSQAVSSDASSSAVHLQPPSLPLSSDINSSRPTPPTIKTTPEAEPISFERRLNDLSSQASSTLRNAATQTSQRFWKEADHLATQAVSRFSMMGAKLNEITGYDRIEGLKKVVTERGQSVVRVSRT